MLLSRSTGQSLANSSRRQCSSLPPATISKSRVTAAISKHDNTADAAVTSYAIETAATAAAAAASMLLGCCMQPSAALALPQQQLEDIRQAIEKDFSQGQYYVTGNLTSSLYDPNCTFKDPTTNVKGEQHHIRCSRLNMQVCQHLSAGLGSAPAKVTVRIGGGKGCSAACSVVDLSRALLAAAACCTTQHKHGKIAEHIPAQYTV
eukprot:GHRQ01020498.1.p1 GENE.GHRQ01020498.1~~GHRQ01020498.1.p1  ORF type:complete len:205 (+),score=42.52 GHRQ01020498.1:143-757(+)